MAAPSLRVLVIGAGLGGLALAQGVRQAGIPVVVFERDRSPAARAQGYRIHLDGRADAALRECLPPRLYDLFVASRGQPSLGVTLFTIPGDGTLQAGPTRLFADAEQGQARPMPGSAVDRLTLRQVLLAGLDEVVHFGKEFTHYELQADGAVRACFADGTSALGQVLVAADGAGSRIRRQFLPRAEVADTGLRWLGGKTLLSQPIRAGLPPQLAETFGALRLGAQAMTALFGLVIFPQDPNQAAARLWAGLRFEQTADYAFWGILGTQPQLGVADDDLDGLSGPELLDRALALSTGWPPAVRTLIECCQPERTFVARFRAARPIDHWPTTTITLLGDAIHVMPPSGSGANLALRDASLLAHALGAVARGEQGLVEALDQYEVEMLSAGFDAVRASLEAPAW